MKLNFQILIITDDNEMFLEINSIFWDKSYNLKKSNRNLNEAITILENYKYDLVIFDYKSSNNFIETKISNYLLTNTRIPFLYLLPILNPVILNDIIESRPTGVVFKPIKHYELTTVISILLNKSRHSNIELNGFEDDIINEYPFIITNVIEYVKANIFNKIDVNELVKQTPWSYDHFIKIFSKFLGLSPYQYILLKKIEKSISYIVGTDLSLIEIAFKFSFESYANYYKAFQKIVGCTPSQFRSRNKAITYLGNYNDFIYEKH